MTDQYLRLDDRRDPKWAYPGGTKENWNAPTIANFFPDIMGPGLTQDEINQGRAIFEGAFEAMLAGAVMPTELEEAGEWREYFAPGCVEEPDAPPVRLHVRVPRKPKSKKMPAMLYFFAAGMGGKPDYFDVEIASYSMNLDCVVIAPQYRPHPENKQPKQLNDSHAAYQWAVDHAEELGIDPDCIVLAGYSIGGQMALGLAQRLKRYGITARGVSALFPPVDDRAGGVSSFITYGGDNLGCEEVQMTWNSFFGPEHVALTALSPEIVPNHAVVNELKGFPPVYMHAAESDPNRDDSLTYFNKLLEANVFCSLHVWPGINHATFFSGGPFELKDKFFAEVTENIADMMKHDLRRPWNK
jgi:acetyl esterase/lipase